MMDFKERKPKYSLAHLGEHRSSTQLTVFFSVENCCFYCRKQRPVAPRLPDPSTVKPLDSDSSDGNDISIIDNKITKS